MRIIDLEGVLHERPDRKGKPDFQPDSEWRTSRFQAETPNLRLPLLRTPPTSHANERVLLSAVELVYLLPSASRLDENLNSRGLYPLLALGFVPAPAACGGGLQAPLIGCRR